MIAPGEEGPYKPAGQSDIDTLWSSSALNRESCARPREAATIRLREQTAPRTTSPRRHEELHRPRLGRGPPLPRAGAVVAAGAAADGRHAAAGAGVGQGVGRR